MYQKIVLLLALLSALHLKAQVSMTLQVPPTGVFQKNQLWNILLVYTGDSPADIKISLTLSDARTNQPVLTATTRNIILTKGARQLKADDVLPVQYNYLTSALWDRSSNGLLMVGSYTACYSVLQYVHAGAMPLAEDCISFDVEPVSPPLLNTPADQDTLETIYPQFTWLPPAPVTIFNDLSYDMILVEVLPGQSAYEAVQRNIPVGSKGNNKNLFYDYPASGRGLDTGKLYAWRIAARNNDQVASLSDTWTFRIKKLNSTTLAKPENSYTKLKRGLDGSPGIHIKTIRLEYNNVANDPALSYQIISLDDAGNFIVKQGNLPIKYGQNFLELNITRGDRLKNNKTYMLQAVNSRHETWSMKFIYYESKLPD